ncbi:MAG: hypothetical protein IK073_03275 [Paludibacteraceae bacterium]|nr:hypothetical protein [Paludibacteraceae bacterium]
MKKLFTLALVALFSASVMAQHEIGAVVGGLNGASYKYWISSNLAVQADLAVGLTAAYTGAYWKGSKFGEGQMDHWDFMLNPNLAYHFDLPANFKLYCGGGVGIGMLGGFGSSSILGKAGANALVGAAYHFPSMPLVMALDFRPGYAIGFEDASYPHYSMFDWKIGFAVRYVL